MGVGPNSHTQTSRLPRTDQNSRACGMSLSHSPVHDYGSYPPVLSGGSAGGAAAGWGELGEAERKQLEDAYARAGLDLQGLLKQVGHGDSSCSLETAVCILLDLSRKLHVHIAQMCMHLRSFFSGFFPFILCRQARRKLVRDKVADLAISWSDIKLGPLIGAGGFGSVYRGTWQVGPSLPLDDLAPMHCKYLWLFPTLLRTGHT